MIRRVLCIAALLLTAGNALAQQDSIQRQIEEYPFGRSALIAKGRHLLIDRFTAGDSAMVRKVVEYFDGTSEASTYIALYPRERLLLYFWIGDYYKILDQDGQYREVTPEREHVFYLHRQPIEPLRDGLERLLEQRSSSQRDQLCERIDSAALTAEEKDFLKLDLLAALTWDWDTTAIRGTVNALADTFLARYPASQYAAFVRENVRFVYRPSDKGYGIELFSGYGLFTGQLHENFGHAVPIGLAWDGYYRRCEVFLRGLLGFSSTHRTIAYPTGQWPGGSGVDVGLFEMALGYQAIDNHWIAWAPFAGIAATDISPSDDDMKNQPGYKDYELKFTTTYSVGCNFDIKINNSFGPIVASHENSYWFLRIRYSYNMPQFAHKYPDSNGNLHLITVGLGAFGRELKRDTR